jgi:pilus assembly protein Flp/PilA
MKKFIALHNDENGQDLIEYALVTAIVSLSAVVALQAVAGGVSSAFDHVTSDLATAIG